MGTGRYIIYASIGLGAVVTIRVSYRVWCLLSHVEQPYAWINSIIPPSGYNYRTDTACTKEHVETQHPQLTDIVEHGTLTVLKRPPDFDRPLPEELYILGTAHVSRKTAEAVYRTIHEVKPDAVVVELCKSRSFMMYREVPPEMLLPSPASTHKLEETAAVTQATVSSEGNACTSAQAPTGESTDAAGNPVTVTTAVAAKGSGTGQTSKKTASRLPSLTEELAGLVGAIKSGASPLHVLLGWAYKRVEAQLDTVVGLEFIRARHAIQELEHERAAQHSQNSTPATTSAGLQHQPEADPPTDLQATQEGVAPQQPSQEHATEQTSAAAAAAAAAVADQQAAVIAAPLDADGTQHPSTQPIQVYLGDVPIQRTLSRMWGVLNVRQKLRLCWQLMWECLTLAPDDEMMEALLQQDMLQLLQEELGAEYPEVLGPLLHERNWHLAYTVHQAAEHGMRRVALVVGRGHVPGVVYCLLHPYRARLARRASKSSADGGDLSERPAQEQLAVPAN